MDSTFLVAPLKIRISAQLAQHVVQDNKKLEVALDLLTLYVQHALLVVRVNIGQQTLVRALSTEPAQLVQHVLQVNKKLEVALGLLTLLVQHALLVIRINIGPAAAMAH